MRTHITILGAAAVFVLAGRFAWATTVILRPGPADGKDISLYERTDIELSSSKSLYTINTGPPGPGRDDFASLIEFDLTTVPAGSVVAANLWLYQNNAPTFSFQHASSELANTIQVQPAATQWEEASVFYSTLPLAWAGYDAEQVVDGVNKWFSWNVTAAVAAWLRGDINNNGFLVTSKLEVRNGPLIVGSAFDASEQPNSPFLEIELMTSQPGDYDRDLDVDGADFLQWQRETGATVAPREGADGNGDGKIDADDLAVWASNFGMASFPVRAAAQPASHAVPEPATLVMVAGALIGLVQRRHRAGVAAIAALVVGLSGSVAVAITVPITEDFATGGANWRDAANNPAPYIASGGVGGTGDGFISLQRSFSPTADPNFASTIFRGHDSFDSSSDAFVGNWMQDGVSRFSFWIRHNASSELSFGTRFATAANSPGANAVASLGLVAPPNQWTRLSMPISPAAIAPEGPAANFTTVFSNVGNLQISVRPGSSVGTTVRFDLDRVSIVPEPRTLALAIAVAGMFIYMKSRRRHLPGPGAAMLALALLASPALAEENRPKNLQFTPLPEPLASFGAATLDDWLYVYGGHAGERHDHSRENVRGTFLRQPLKGGPWESLPGGPALQSPALVAHGGKLYRIGGLSARNAPDETADLHSVDTVDCFDPATKRWSSMAKLPEARSSHDAVAVGDRIFVAGGWRHHGEEGDGDWLEGVLELDLSQRDPKWQDTTKAPFRRRALALAALGQKLYVIGGLTPETDFSRRVDVYDLTSRTWSDGPELPESDYNGFGASAFTVGGRLFVSSQSNDLLALVEDERSWGKAGRLDSPRFFHRMIPGPHSSVLLIGGANDEEGHLASIKCWTPAQE